MLQALWHRLRDLLSRLLGVGGERYKPTNEGAYRAKLAADKLLDNIGSGEREYTSQELGIYVADVEIAIDSFDLQLKLLRRFDRGFPCIVHPDTGAIPISLAGIAWPNWLVSEAQSGPFLEEFFFPRPRDLWWEIIDRLYERSGFQVKRLEQSEAIGFLHHGLVRFLTTRFSARRSEMSRSPGVFFSVFTRRRGLRVHYSPSFFIEWRVFGSPTSPVRGWIQPGLYKFATEGYRFPLAVDPGDYKIPPPHGGALGGCMRLKTTQYQASPRLVPTGDGRGRRRCDWIRLASSSELGGDYPVKRTAGHFLRARERSYSLSRGGHRWQRVEELGGQWTTNGMQKHSLSGC
jgi:hypothetical protein